MSPSLALHSGFDPETASRLCFLSDLAYDCFKDDEENPVGSVCKDNFAFIVRRYPDRTLIAFQGSNDAVDFFNIDACFLIKEPEEEPTFPPVHAGFWKAVVALLDLLRAELSRGDTRRPLYLGGHSLGGAIAILIAARLKEMAYPVAGVYGAGAPPVGAVKFFNYWQTLGVPAFLLVYERDGVPFLQPSGVHVAPLIHLDRRARVRNGRPGFSWINPLRWSAWRDDHDSQNYLTATAKILDRERQGKS